MVTVDVIQEDGSIITQAVESKKFAVVVDGVAYTPAYVEEIEIDNVGETTRLMDQCRNTEMRRNGSGNWMMTVRGIVSKDTADGGLTLQRLMSLTQEATVRTISDYEIDGDIVVDDIILTQSTDIVSINTGSGDNLAFSFQLVLGEQESQ